MLFKQEWQLPRSLTRQDIFDSFLEECGTGSPEDNVSYGHFLRIWREEFKFVKICQPEVFKQNCYYQTFLAIVDKCSSRLTGLLVAAWFAQS